MIESASTINGTQTIGGHEVTFEKPEERATLDREDFMNLFITELQYQDPMKPMDSAEMSSQLAQFNMVDLMNANNEAMTKLLESDESRTRLMAVSFIGHEVRYDGNELLVKESGPAPFEMTLEEACTSCKITIRDENGDIVASWDAGVMEPGTHALDWDGTDLLGEPVEPGIYHVSIEAKDEKGEPVDISTKTSGIVAGIEYPEEGLPLLNIYHGPSISLDEIDSVGG